MLPIIIGTYFKAAPCAREGGVTYLGTQQLDRAEQSEAKSVAYNHWNVPIEG